MDGLYIERRELRPGASLSWDIAHHLYARTMEGKAVVIATAPQVLLASVRKQWSKVLRQVQRERSSTLQAARIRELTRELERIQRLHFMVGVPDAYADGDIVFIREDFPASVLGSFSTLYLTCAVENSRLQLLTSGMPRHSLLVMYDPR